MSPIGLNSALVRPTFMPPTVYVFRCESGKYYVGRTSRAVQERFDEHVRGRGSAWTSKYAPVEIVEAVPSASPFLEEAKVLEYMRRFGVDNVRGASYASAGSSLPARTGATRATRRATLRTTARTLAAGRPGLHR